MSKRIFAQEQIDAILQTGNVARCSAKSITYNDEFKIHAVKRYEEGWMPSEIFRQAGFDLEVIGRERPQDCLLDWRRIYERKGERGLREARKGAGKKRSKTKLKELTDAEKIKYLEAQVAYLKAENDFLAKLRAKRRN